MAPVAVRDVASFLGLALAVGLLRHAGASLPPLELSFSAATVLVFSLAIGAALATVPLAVVLAVFVDRSLPRRPRRRSKARGRLSFTTEAAWSVVQLRSLWDTAAAAAAADGRSSPGPKPPLHPGIPAVLQAAVDGVLARVMRDFVKSWYGRLSPSSAFPAELETTIREALSTLAGRVAQADLASLAVGRVIPLVTAHLDAFSKAEHTLSGSRRQSTLLGGPSSEGLDVFLVQAFGPANLHPAISGQALDSRPAQEAHLRALVADLLALVLPARSRSEIVDVLAREIVTCTVLMPVVEMLADPDFWNRLLDDQATKHIREQKLIHQLRAALETTSLPTTTTASSSPSSGPALPTGGATLAPPRQRAASVASSRRGISSRTDARAFDAFVKGIGQIDGVLEARRMRSDVEREIRRTKELLETSAAGGTIATGETAPDLRAHLERLVHARSRVDRRLSQLSGVEPGPAAKLSATPTTGSLSAASLGAILANPSSLSYLMEFMERRQRIVLVQFWLMVESFRIPLENLDLDAPDADEAGSDGDGDDGERVRTAREDLGMIWETYIEEDVLGAGIADRFGPPIEAFLRGKGRKGLHKARRSMFGAQQHVYHVLNEDFFPLFRSSDLYFKAVANVPSTLSVPAVSHSSVPRVPAPQPPAFPHRATTSGIPRAGSPPVTMVIPPSKLRKAGSASSSLELGKPAPYAAPLVPSLSLESEPGGSGGLFDGPSDVALSRSKSAQSRARTTSPVPSFEQPPPLASPPLRSPRLQFNSHFDFLVSTDGEGTTSRPPLFVDPADGGGASDDDDYIQVQRMDAIQAALTDIIAKDESVAPPSSAAVFAAGRRRSHQKPATSRRMPSDVSSMARSLDSLLDPAPVQPSSLTDDSAAAHLESSLPDLLAVRRPSKRVFDDDDDDDGATTPSLLSSLMDAQTEAAVEVRDLTAIGILQLPAEIARFTARIDKLRGQEALLDALIRKAELAGNKRELALLENSQQSLVREVRGLAFQKRQWQQQELDSRLHAGRTHVSIPSATNLAEDGKPITRYLVEVQQLAEDGAFAHGWVVARRYNEFFNLHHDLREKLASVRHLALPGKMLVTAMSSSFVDSRRAGLEKYLQALIMIPDACASLELRAFLSQSSSSSSPYADTPPGQAKAGPSLPRPQDLVKSLYRTVTSGFDDIGGVAAGPDSILDLLSQGLTKQATDLALLAGFAPDGSAAAAAAQDTALNVASPGMSDLMGLKPMDGETASSYFTAPICDLFVEVFELKENNWLRRQAIVIILQQILGGTIERKLRDVVDRLTGPTSILGYVTSFSNALWPGGVRRPPTVPRTDEEKRRTKEEVARKLPSLIPDIASNMIGRGNTRRGAKRLFAVLQHQKLNQSLVHAIIDEVIFAVFPELNARAAAG